MTKTLSTLEQTIVQFCKEQNCLPELCVLVDYDPDIGKVKEHWAPSIEVAQLAKYLVRNNQL